jgi:phenylalanyl-tRNA synthetase beta chain
MGAKNTAIDENTRKIIIESATFSLTNLRKTGMHHGIFSEAITRFTKGQPAGATLPVAKEFARLIAHQMKPLAIFDEHPVAPKPSVVKITTRDINNLLGTNYSYATVEKTLRNVGFKITCDCGKPDKCPCKQINVTAPYWRTDIHIKEDITEEIGRLLGYDNITPTTPPIFSATKTPLFTLKTQIRNTLSATGGSETLTYSFISENLIKKAGQTPKNSYQIINALSPDLQFVRQQLVPSLLEKIHPNIKDGFSHFALFEMNQVYLKDQGLTDEKVPKTFNNLAFAITSDYYTAKKYLNSLGYYFELRPIKPSREESYFEPKRSADIYLDNTNIGIIGEIKASVRAALKLPSQTSAFELSLEPLLNLPPQKISPKISEFPLVQRDLTLKIPETTPYQTITDQIHQILQEQNLIFNVIPIGIYQPKDAKHKNLTLHLEFAHPTKTLTSAEINTIITSLESPITQ